MIVELLKRMSNDGSLKKLVEEAVSDNSNPLLKLPNTF